MPRTTIHECERRGCKSTTKTDERVVPEGWVVVFGRYICSDCAFEVREFATAKPVKVIELPATPIQTATKEAVEAQTK